MDEKLVAVDRQTLMDENYAVVDGCRVLVDEN